jgi:uncharacterized protein YjbI with pentapeptide repeats
MSQRCPNCEAEFPKGANFCSYCGHPVSQEGGRAAHPQQMERFLSNLQRVNSSPSLTATSGGGSSRTVLEMWSGGAAILAGILFLTAVLFLVLPGGIPLLRDEDVDFPVAALGMATGTLLTAIALPVLQTRQAGRSGKLGWAGVILAVIGMGTLTPFIVMDAFGVNIEPFRIVREAGGAIFLVGLAGFGIATVRANVFPRWAAVMFVVGLPLGSVITLLLSVPALGFFAESWAFLTVGLGISVAGLMRLGYALWTHARLKKTLSKRLSDLSKQSRVRQSSFADKTIWDWLHLLGVLAIPVVLTVAGFWFTVDRAKLEREIEAKRSEAEQKLENQRAQQAQKIENQRAQQAQKIENQRAEAERELAKQRAQDEALQAYLSQMGSLLLEKDLRNPDADSEARTLARARTTTVLERLDPSRTTAVMQFLGEAKLVQRVDGKGPIIGLSGADLSHADLENFDLDNADLNNADLSWATLFFAFLRKANLLGANLSDADLTWANLSGATTDDSPQAILDQALNSDNATMPSGPSVTSYSNLSTAHTDETVDYPQTPPVGGPHDSTWQNCGFYSERVRDENAVHSLEHAAVWITYSSDLPQDQVGKLQDRAHRQTYILISPYPDLPSPVVASAWGKQMELEGPDDPDLVRFIRAYRQGQQAPERENSCSNGVGSPE